MIFNGLGNQMSQYAFYLQKKKINESTYFLNFGRDHNGYELDNVFDIHQKNTLKEKFLYIIFRILLTDKKAFYLLKKMLTIFGCKIINENFDYNFKPEFLKPSKGIKFYYGGWHNEENFLNIKWLLYDTFKFKKYGDLENQKIIEKIKETNSISIHIRRGDFLDTNNINLFGNICSIAYYKEAISIIEKKIDNSYYFVFSNDMEWVQENFNLKNVTYVNGNFGKKSWKDMYLMSLCKNNIIANSTFSWWGAWLNKNPNKIIISPDRFIRSKISSDIYPNEWIKISTE